MVAEFILGRVRVPLYALLWCWARCGAVLDRGDVTSPPSGALFGQLLPTLPSFEPRALLGLDVPLFLVTLVGQNLPGLMVLKNAGYEPKPGMLIVGTGTAWMAMAPFGAHALNLAAITAALCTSDDAHPDRARRWTVAIVYASFYLVLAIFSPALVRLFLALPHALIAALTVAADPLAHQAWTTCSRTRAARCRHPHVFFVTGSGLALFGLGAAFWGLVVGFLALGAKKLWGPKSG